ncbi:MAG: LTA synthase family protein [Clostridiales bacterium]|nr:LTA synthase family protein [Clostridiales bacterium]
MGGYWRRHKAWLIASLACLIAAAPLQVLFLQAQIGAAHALAPYPLLLAYSSVVMFFITLLISGICGNAFWGTGIVFAILTLLGYADTIKYSVRMEHVYPDDLIWFFHANQLNGMYDASGLPYVILLMAVFCAPGFVVALLIARRKRRKAFAAAPHDDGVSEGAGEDEKTETETEVQPVPERFSRRWWLINLAPRLAPVVIGAGFLILLALPITNPYGGDIPAIDYQYIAWNQSSNFDRNGYVAAFISNLRYAGMDEPQGYSKEAVQAIADKYRARADEENASRTDPADEGVDVIFIQNESFCDPDRFKDIYPYTGNIQELVPNLHKVETESTHGYCYSPRYGGGTANIEFEALTGFSTYYLGWAYPFQSMLPQMGSFPSVANVFGQTDGYQTVGLHAYGATMYRRSTVYPIMGFDAFHGVEDFHNLAHANNSYYVSDASAYAETEGYLDGKYPIDSKNAPTNKFVTLITMENHPQYGSQYSTHASLSTADNTDFDARMRIADYMSLIHNSDQELGDFLKWVDSRDKKTVVVFWGDHLPGVYDNLFEVNKDLGYETPFFIYSNYDKTEKDIGAVSPNYISTIALDYLNAKKTPWDYLTDDLKTTTPILTAAYWSVTTPPDTEALRDYRMIEYDVMDGKGYSREMGMFDVAKEK